MGAPFRAGHSPVRRQEEDAGNREDSHYGGPVGALGSSIQRRTGRGRPGAEGDDGHRSRRLVAARAEDRQTAYLPAVAEEGGMRLAAVDFQGAEDIH